MCALSHVLVVEDHDACREALSALLRREGASVVSTGSGGEAVALAREREFDVVFTDLGLPDLDGTVVIQRIRATGKGHPRLVVITGSGAAEVEAAYRAGAEAVFVKPYKWDAVARYLRAA